MRNDKEEEILYDYNKLLKYENMDREISSDIHIVVSKALKFISDIDKLYD